MFVTVDDGVRRYLFQCDNRFDSFMATMCFRAQLASSPGVLPGPRPDDTYLYGVFPSKGDKRFASEGSVTGELDFANGGLVHPESTGRKPKQFSLRRHQRFMMGGPVLSD